VTLARLAERWRAEADILRRRGASVQADVLLSCAGELDGAATEAELEALTLAQAAEESGYSVDHLARLIRQGKLRNAGRPNAPLVRRGDMPRKPSRLPGPEGVTHLGPRSSRQVVRAIAQGGDQR